MNTLEVFASQFHAGSAQADRTGSKTQPHGPLFTNCLVPLAECEPRCLCPQSPWRNCHHLLCAAFTALGLSGCMGFDAISNEVRPGGTVMVAVDAVRHTMPDVSRVQATLFDNAGAEHKVALRHMLRVQPDPVSAFGIGEYRSNKGMYAGQKLAIVDLVNPDTLMPPSAPAIASGESLLELYMPDLEQSSVHSLKIIPEDALPGAASNAFRVLQHAGNLAPLYTHWLEQASPLPHLRIQTEVGELYDPSRTISGALFRLRFSPSDFSGSAQWPGFAVTKLTSDPNLQLSWRARKVDDAGTAEIAITVRNPHGFTRHGMEVYSAGLQSLFEDLSSLAIGWLPARYAGSERVPFQWAAPPRFFDTHGNLVEGLSASLVAASGN